MADWSGKGEGQRHVNWCRRYEHGEEDVDWEVVAIPNKGLGIRAKRLLPEGYKIIVEPVFTDPHGHPGKICYTKLKMSLSIISILFRELRHQRPGTQRRIASR